MGLEDGAHWIQVVFEDNAHGGQVGLGDGADIVQVGLEDNAPGIQVRLDLKKSNFSPQDTAVSYREICHLGRPIA